MHDLHGFMHLKIFARAQIGLVKLAYVVFQHRFTVTN